MIFSQLATVRYFASNDWHPIKLYLSVYSSNNFCQVDHFEGMCCPKARNFIWKLFEEPDSSTGARVNKIIKQHKKFTLSLQVLVIVSSLFLLASILMLILSTMPEFQVFPLTEIKRFLFGVVTDVFQK